MMVPFSARSMYILHFECISELDKIKQSDVIGALLTYTAETSTDFNLSRLQNLKKIGKIEYAYDKINDRAFITLPVSGSKLQVSLLASIIETIQKISLYQAKIRLVNVEQSQKIHANILLKRAAEIYNTGFSQEVVSKDLIGKLEQLVNLKKVVSVGDQIIGSDFYTSENVYVVEGRRDVQLLANYGILNTIGIGGLTYNLDELRKLLSGKKLHAFFDGDSGGNAIYEKLSKEFEFVSKIATGEKTSVEDMSKKEVFSAIEAKVYL